MSVFKKKSDNAKHAAKLNVDVSKAAIGELTGLIKDKLARIQLIIQNTSQALNYYKSINIISNSDIIVCTSTLIECFDKTQSMIISMRNSTVKTAEEINALIDQLQQIIDKLSIIMCGYGTGSIEDVFFISFGTELGGARSESSLWSAKKHLIFNHVKPIGYKTFHWKQSRTKPKHISDLGHNITTTDPICTNKIVEDVSQIETSSQFECFEIDFSGKPSYVRIHGIRVVVHNEKTQKTLIIQGIVDDLPIECLQNEYIYSRKSEITENLPESDTFQPIIMQRIVDSMTIKDSLIWGNDDYYKKHIAILTDANYVKFNKLNVTIRKFLDMDSHNQRSMLINLLIYNQEDEVQYITYLLYDLISAKSSNTAVDSAEQQVMYDSFPWRVKLYFKDTMKHTIKYTKDMISKYDVSRISLEQQVYVMKVPENVREKAMSKLKEIKGKTDDTGAKAKQYLEGLLKIPFGVYREEPILKKPKQNNKGFLEAVDRLSKMTWANEKGPHYPFCLTKSHYSATEIVQICKKIEKWVGQEYTGVLETSLDDQLSTKQINKLFSTVVEKCKLNVKKTATSKTEKRECVKTNLTNLTIDDLLIIRDEIYGDGHPAAHKAVQDLRSLTAASMDLKTDLDSINQILDESIHGHEHAKGQILKIIGQWMNGEQSGYCFGFEGSPGVGKTSLAKRGLANCLKNELGESRPFAFIALGGSCNGSTLEGHSYTYVNSTWGRIVDVLMDSKCMNPIIYIDELDKVSKTEHGKEIIGILMHLIDTTQNSGFQDKYFSGIDVDLSKVLFIFSYNDASQIDRILLDRIHRIKFDNLSLQEKLVITRKYVLPEINQKMGLESCVELSDNVIEHLIESYTHESGVRKLKEVIFDLHGEINVELLRCENVDDILPIVITEDMIGTRYISKYDKIIEKKIHNKAEVGVINGLWANSLGGGGIIPIQAVFFPTTTFLELRLTGMQGDVMKESMNVAKSLAWSLLDDDVRTACLERFEKTKEQGIHIHCPDGATPKDGPSAGAAITAAIYSLLSGRSIKHNVAMTGEINLQGSITEIGGLEQKIFGGTKAGVDTFLYPESNQRDLNKIKTKPFIGNSTFYPVSHISEVFSKIFV